MNIFAVAHFEVNGSNISHNSQEIAAFGCFSLGMIARFEVLNDRGAWMYPRLFWECGVLGQLLYLEAHAVGIAATGIGCYFDDPGVLSSSHICNCVLFIFWFLLCVNSMCSLMILQFMIFLD